jgi:hypothetical protein
MKKALGHRETYTLGVVGGILIALGTIFPSLFAIFLQPRQPPWQSAAVFVQHYHQIQTLPFYFGFFLVVGSVMLLVATYLMAPLPQSPLVGLLFGVIGSAIVCINYIAQTTYIPAMVAEYTPDQAVMLQALSMANPTSLAWAFEMWGYGGIGLGTWFAASVFGATGLERVAKVLFVLNGILSLVGALWTAVDLGWVLEPAGYIAFGVWNLLYLVLAVVSIVVFLRRKRALD